MTRVAELTGSGDRLVTLDQLSRELNPEPADEATRIDTIRTAISDATRCHLGHQPPLPSTTEGFVVYRNIPLLSELDLRRLNDQQLTVHVGALEVVNRRLQLAKQPPAELPEWISDRLARSGASSPHIQQPNRPSAQARLQSVQHGPVAARGVSL